jgi:Fe-S-cluster containining protein
MKRRASVVPKTSVAAVTAIYAELDQRPIERACTRLTECCQFKRTGKIPFLTRGEAVVAAQAWRATGRTHLPERPDGSCPMLDPNGHCLIYAARPFGCRTHYCSAAGGPYARREVVDLIRRLEEVDREIDGDGPHPLPFAIARELRG